MHPSLTTDFWNQMVWVWIWLYSAHCDSTYTKIGRTLGSMASWFCDLREANWPLTLSFLTSKMEITASATQGWWGVNDMLRVKDLQVIRHLQERYIEIFPTILFWNVFHLFENKQICSEWNGINPWVHTIFIPKNESIPVKKDRIEFHLLQGLNIS